MFLHSGMHAVKLLVDSAEYIGGGIVENYFNGFSFEEGGLFEWAEAIIPEPELQCDEYIFGVLSGIMMALKHDRDVMAAYSMMECEEHTFGLPYPVLVEAILAVADFHTSIANPMVFTCSYCLDSSVVGAGWTVHGKVDGDTDDQEPS
jgi:hypothetical protein